MIWGFCLLFKFIKNTDNAIKVKQAKLILYSTFISFILGTISGAVFTEIKLYDIPPVTNIIVLILAIGYICAIAKYRFLMISPAMVAENILSTMPDLLLLLDGDRNIVTVNNAVSDLLGYENKEIEGKKIHFIFPENSNRVQIDSICTNVKNKNVEFNFEAKNKESIPVLVSSSAIKGDFNEIAGYVCIAREIKKLKKTEEDLKIAVGKLEHSNEELEQFASVASHDLQEPLRMVSSFLQIINRRYTHKLDDEGKEFIYYAVDGATRMQKLISDLLAYSRVTTQGKEMKIVNSNELLKKTLSNLQEIIKDTNAVVTHDELPEVLGDESQQIRLFQNLINNSLKFCKDREPKIHISVKSEDKNYVFSVKDNGIGIKPEDKDKIFKIFQRLHSRDEYPGTGIGLAVCKRIVERHLGRMWVESEFGQGTTFYFTIPSIKK